MSSRMPRRKFLELSATGVAAGTIDAPRRARRAWAGRDAAVYSGDRLSRVAFPMGGMGAGMVCLEGTGALSHVSLGNRPEVFNEPCVFAAVGIRGNPAAARVLEGPVPGWKLFGRPGTGNGAEGTSYGLPRFSRAAFRFRFPFGFVTLEDPRVPVRVTAFMRFPRSL